MATVSHNDIWLYIYEQGEVRTRDLLNHFVKTKQISRGSLFKYKRQLEQEGKIASKPIHERPPYNLYFVPENMQQYVEALRRYKRFPPTLYGYCTQDIEWTDAPKDMFLTAVKEKILWHDEETGAIMSLLKVPLGLWGEPHIFPYANQWYYGLEGESENPNGKKTSAKGIFGFLPKGALEIGSIISKETLLIIFWDGPRTQIKIKPDEIDRYPRMKWGFDARTRWTQISNSHNSNR
ncbi:MAG: hypothetical protein NWE83_10955 [Candidatus Bathyarchaeota archaeon]|nr:hypothetical protein [Candidatus Bathyarchaeota archaeon]